MRRQLVILDLKIWMYHFNENPKPKTTCQLILFGPKDFDTTKSANLLEQFPNISNDQNHFKRPKLTSLLEAKSFPVSSACWIPSGASSVSCWPCHRLAKFHVVVPWRPKLIRWAMVRLNIDLWLNHVFVFEEFWLEQTSFAFFFFFLATSC